MNKKSSIVELVPVVAIGASAGGLDPIEVFFDKVHSDLGCAYVIVQHLSPEFRSLMDQLLARRSPMAIKRISNGMELQPNTIYLNLPRTRLTLKENTLSYEEMSADDPYQLPINDFFCSLAEARRSSAISIVLSGTGSDGTIGCEAIAKAKGIVLVQDPSTSRFDGMPRSVMAKGIQSLTATVPTLAEAVRLTLSDLPIDHLQQTEPAPIDDPLLDILSLIRSRFGTDLSKYKAKTLQRRIERRALMNRVSSIGELRDLVRSDPKEIAKLYADLLIEVTSFFRDREAFDYLRDKTIPELVEQAKEQGRLRIWVAGCASGEEAYSVGMLIHEYLRINELSLDVKIFATDIHERSMAQAQSGTYDNALLNELPDKLIKRYFNRGELQSQVKLELRKTLSFSVHDVTRDPPFSNTDMVCCRNLLIYLVDAAQENALRMFHFSLRVNGVLFLGSSEHLGALDNEFSVVDSNSRLFKKRRDVHLLQTSSIFEEESLLNRLNHGIQQTQASGTYESPVDPSIELERNRLRKKAFETVLEQYSPPGFLLDEEGNIEHIFGSAASFLPLQSGSFSRNIVDIIMDELKPHISTAFNHLRNSNLTKFQRGLTYKNDEGIIQSLELNLTRVQSADDKNSFFLLHFIEEKASEPPTMVAAAEVLPQGMTLDSAQRHINQLEISLQASEENLQTIIEEVETSNEELQSANEELMSGNEELQTTNEELHSVNEELYTVSVEHRRDNQELQRRDQDIDQLMQSWKISLVYLDEQLCLMRYTGNVGNVFNLDKTDIGRTLSPASIIPNDTNILETIEAVNQNHVAKTLEMHTGDQSFVVKILPNNLGEETHSRGIIINVIETTQLARIQDQLNTTSELLETQNNLNKILDRYAAIVEGMNCIVVRWSPKSHEVLYCNEAFAERWNSTQKKLIGTNLLNLRTPAEAARFKESLKGLKPGESITNLPSVLIEKNGKKTKKTTLINTKAVSIDGESIDHYLSVGMECPDHISLVDNLAN